MKKNDTSHSLLIPSLSFQLRRILCGERIMQHFLCELLKISSGNINSSEYEDDIFQYQKPKECVCHHNTQAIETSASIVS